MRVDERSLNDAVSATASRAAESQRIQVDTAKLSSATNSAAGDHVELSGLAARISQSMQSMASRSAERVSQLQKEYLTGRYQPDALQLSRVLAK